MNNLALFLAFLLPLAPGDKKIDLLKGDGLDQWEAFGKAEWKVTDGVLEGGQGGDPKRSGVLVTKGHLSEFRPPVRIPHRRARQV